MKLNNLLIVTCLSFATALSVASCKKSSSGSSSKLVGTWKDVQSGYDMNGNGVMDAGEMSADTFGTVTVTFNGNGTGSEHVVIPGFFDSTVAITKWTLSNGDKDLTITDAAGQTAFTHVTTLTGTDLVIADTTNPVSWTAFKKQ
ncbi:MAG: lipocalin family protein [Bacteroidetes bacterium]|nr:lipocalin family protein [Bacteroidota bacterium]